MQPTEPARSKSFIPPAFSSTKPTLDRHRIAVLPLNNISPEPADEYFASGLTDELTSTISRIRGFRVISQTSAARAKESRKGIREIARELDVGTLLEGNVRKAGNVIRVTAQLVDARTEEHLWSKTYDRGLGDIFAVQSDIALSIAKELESQLTESDKTLIQRKPTTSPEAHEHYLRGLYNLSKETKEGVDKAIECFNYAIERDPNFALAYSQLGRCYFALGFRGYLPEDQWYPKAKQLVAKALELDDDLAEAHVTMSRILGMHWEFRKGEEEVKRALELNPSSAYAHRIYPHYLAIIEGKPAEAEEVARRSEELDPLSMSIVSEVGFTLTYLRKYDEALEKLKKCLDLAPMNPSVLSMLGSVYLEKSMFHEALSVFQKAVEISEGELHYKASLCYGYARAGKMNDAMRLLNELKEKLSETHVDAALMAQVYVAIGNVDEAFNWLDQAYKQHSTNLTYLRVDPVWDPIRSDPRFTTLQDKVYNEA